MEGRRQWMNFHDFDEPSGTFDVVPPTPCPQQSVSRPWKERTLGVFQRHKPRTEMTGQVHNIQARPVKDGHTALKADPDAPRATSATARRALLGSVLSCRLSVIILAGLAGLVLYTCVWHGLPIISGAHHPSHPLFELGSWDEIQRDINILHSMVSSERFSDSEQIQPSVEQGQNSMRRCRFLIEVMRNVKEWVFRGECTSNLPLVVRRSCVKIKKAIDCINHTDTALAITRDQIHKAQSRDNETITVILTRYRSPFSNTSPEQKANDDERFVATRNSLSKLKSVQSHLVVVTKSYQLEHHRLLRLSEDMGRLDDLSHHLQEGAVISECSTQEENQTAWDCHDFDIPGLRDSFLTMALNVIGDDEKVRQFQSRFYPTSFDANA